MTKPAYEKPTLKQIDFEDTEVVSMSDACKDITIPDIPGLNGCATLGGGPLVGGGS